MGRRRCGRLDAPVLPPCARGGPRRAGRAGSDGRPRGRAVLAISGLAVEALQCRVQRLAGPRTPTRPAGADGRSGPAAAAGRIRGPARGGTIPRRGSARGRTAPAAGRALRGFAARVARAGPHPDFAARAAGPARAARNGGARSHFSGIRRNRLPGGARLLSPLYGRRALPGSRVEPVRAWPDGGRSGAPLRRAVCRARSPRPGNLRAAVPRRGQGQHAGAPRGRLAGSRRIRHGAHPDAAARPQNGALPHPQTPGSARAGALP